MRRSTASIAAVGFVVFSRNAVFPWRDVLGNVMAGRCFAACPRPGAEEMARDWINRVGLKGFEDNHPHQLSGGMRKRVRWRRPSSNNPQVLLMDEPFSSLDVQTRELMQEELLQLWALAKSAVLFVTHDLDERSCSPDRVAAADHAAGAGEVGAHHRPAAPAQCRHLALRRKFIAIARKISDDLREEVCAHGAGH